MLTESTTLFVFVEELDRLLHEIICLSYHRFKLRNGCELFDVNDITDYIGHADDELDYFLVTCVLDIQDLLVRQLVYYESLLSPYLYYSCQYSNGDPYGGVELRKSKLNE